MARLRRGGTDLQGGDDALEGGHGAGVGGAAAEAGDVLGHVREDELEVDEEALCEDGAGDGVGGGVADEGDLELWGVSEWGASGAGGHARRCWGR